MHELSQKTLVMLVGPSCIGKSTLMNEVTRQNPEAYGYVNSFTTRSQRQGEVTHYNFISKEEALSLHDAGQTITYFEHPTTHDRYGTTIASYTSPINLLDTLSGSVKGYRDLPFKKTITISLTTSPEKWREWFLERYPAPSDEATKRLAEAKQSIRWSLDDAETLWLINDDTIETVATRCADIIVGLRSSDDGRPCAENILGLIDTLWQ